MNQKKISIVITIDSLAMGGAQHLVYELIKNIDFSAFSVTIICTDGTIDSLLETSMMQESNDYYSIIFLKNRYFIKIDTTIKLINKIFIKILKEISSIFIIFELYGILKKIKPDVIHAHQHGIWAAFWAIPHNVPIITTIHTNPKATFCYLTEKFFFYTTLLLKKNILVAISQYNYDLVKKHWKYSIIRWINNGIDINIFYSKQHDQFSFINVSRQDKNKNQLLIVNAFFRLFNENKKHQMLLYLIGDGDYHNLLVQKVKEYNLEEKVIFTGYIDSAKDYIAISDVYISSSHREGLPLSVLEAMAAGLPVIATDVGGVRELAQENGILIEDNDEDGLYTAMKELRDNKDIRLSKGKKSLEMVKDFSADEMTRQYSALYRECATR